MPQTHSHPRGRLSPKEPREPAERPVGEGGDAHAGSAEVARRPAAGEQPDSSRRVAPGRAPEAAGLAFVTPRAAWHTEKASRSTRDARRRVPEGWTPGAGAPPAARRSLTCALPKLLPDDQASRTNRRRGLAVTLRRDAGSRQTPAPRVAPGCPPAVSTCRRPRPSSSRCHWPGRESGRRKASLIRKKTF